METSYGHKVLTGFSTPANSSKDGCALISGLSQYSGDPRTEWQLNTFTSKQQMLEAVRNFKYKGGNTFTGTDNEALQAFITGVAPRSDLHGKSQTSSSTRREKLVGFFMLRNHSGLGLVWQLEPKFSTSVEALPENK